MTGNPAFVRGPEGLHQLAHLLRQDMPEGFLWDFTEISVRRSGCRTCGCALGLAKYVWPEFDEPGASARLLAAHLFKMPDIVVDRIFYDRSRVDRPHAYAGKAMDAITPSDVANAIDDYLRFIGHIKGDDYAI